MRMVILEIDCLRPDFIGAYGNEWLETPTIDRLAAAGAVFDQHVFDSPGPTTVALPWGMESLIGLGVETATSGFARTDINRTMRELGKSQNAVLFVKSQDLVPPWDLPDNALEPFTTIEDDDSAALEPYRGELPLRIDDEESFDRLHQTYAAAVMRFDSNLAARIADIRKHWNDALWILTSRRGLPLGEHGTVGEPAPLHEEFVHLPLIMTWPDGQHAGRRIAAITQPVDLLKTILGLFEVMPQEQGVMPLLRSVHATLRPHIVSTDGTCVGIRTPDWYLLRAAPAEPPQLYVKPDDRWEVNDVARQHEEVVSELLRHISG